MTSLPNEDLDDCSTQDAPSLGLEFDASYSFETDESSSEINDTLDQLGRISRYGNRPR